MAASKYWCIPFYYNQGFGLGDVTPDDEEDLDDEAKQRRKLIRANSTQASGGGTNDLLFAHQQSRSRTATSGGGGGLQLGRSFDHASAASAFLKKKASTQSLPAPPGFDHHHQNHHQSTNTNNTNTSNSNNILIQIDSRYIKNFLTNTFYPSQRQQDEKDEKNTEFWLPSYYNGYESGHNHTKRTSPVTSPLTTTTNTGGGSTSRVRKSSTPGGVDIVVDASCDSSEKSLLTKPVITTTATSTTTNTTSSSSGGGGGGGLLTATKPCRYTRAKSAETGLRSPASGIVKKLSFNLEPQEIPSNDDIYYSSSYNNNHNDDDDFDDYFYDSKNHLGESLTKNNNNNNSNNKNKTSAHHHKFTFDSLLSQSTTKSSKNHHNHNRSASASRATSSSTTTAGVFVVDSATALLDSKLVSLSKEQQQQQQQSSLSTNNDNDKHQQLLNHLNSLLLASSLDANNSQSTTTGVGGDSNNNLKRQESSVCDTTITTNNTNSSSSNHHNHHNHSSSSTSSVVQGFRKSIRDSLSIKNNRLRKMLNSTKKESTTKSHSPLHAPPLAQTSSKSYDLTNHNQSQAGANLLLSESSASACGSAESGNSPASLKLKNRRPTRFATSIDTYRRLLALRLSREKAVEDETPPPSSPPLSSSQTTTSGGSNENTNTINNLATSTTTTTTTTTTTATTVIATMGSNGSPNGCSNSNGGASTNSTTNNNSSGGTKTNPNSGKSSPVNQSPTVSLASSFRTFTPFGNNKNNESNNTNGSNTTINTNHSDKKVGTLRNSKLMLTAPSFIQSSLSAPSSPSLSKKHDNYSRSLSKEYSITDSTTTTTTCGVVGGAGLGGGVVGVGGGSMVANANAGRICMRVLYDCNTHVLTTSLIQSNRLLASADKCKLYSKIQLQITLANKEKAPRYKSTTKEYQEIINFNENFYFPNVEKESLHNYAILINLFGKETFGSDKLVSQATYSLANLHLNNHYNYLTLYFEEVVKKNKSESFSSLNEFNGPPYAGSGIAGLGGLAGLPGRGFKAANPNAIVTNPNNLNPNEIPSLLIGLKYDALLGNLFVHIIKGNNLIDRYSSDKSPNTFVKIILEVDNTEVKYQTAVKRSSPSPTYDESFEFSLATFQVENAKLFIYIYSKRLLSSKNLIGCIIFDDQPGHNEYVDHLKEAITNDGEDVKKWHYLKYY